MKTGLAFVALLLLVAAAGARQQSEADKVKAVLTTQARLLKQGRFRVMYDTTYTANFRARCPWRVYLRRQRFGRRYLGPGFTLRRLRARILSGTQALLAYRFVRANGQVAAEVTFRQRDVYVKIGQQWYDEYDRVSDC
jgi:hypothetical protein